MGQPFVDHVLVKTSGSQAVAAARIGARLAGRKLGELSERLRSCFRRIEPFLQARKYMRAVTSEMPKRHAWTVAEHVRGRSSPAAHSAGDMRTVDLGAPSQLCRCDWLRNTGRSPCRFGSLLKISMTRISRAELLFSVACRIQRNIIS